MKKSTWIVLAIAVALGLIYILTKDKKVSVGIKRIDLPAFDSSKIDDIEILGSERAHLKKEDGIWKIEIGAKDDSRFVEADQEAVKEMLNSASKVENSYFVTSNLEKEEEFGIKGDMATTITLKSNNTVLWSLVLGKGNVDGSRYARVPDKSGIYAVKGSFYPLTRNGVSDWRPKNIWLIGEPDLVEFRVEHPGKNELLLKKDEEGVWKVADTKPVLPSTFRADKLLLANYVRSLVNQHATGFVDEKIELSSPVAIFKAKIKNGNEKILEVFSNDEKTYLARLQGNEQIFKLSKSNFDRLDRPVLALRDLSILSFNKEDISMIKLRTKTGFVTAEKTNGAWTLVDQKTLPKGFEFDPERAIAIVNDLSTLVGERLAEQSKDQPQDSNWQKNWFIKLSDDKGHAVDIYVGRIKGQDREFLVRGNIDNEVYVVNNPLLSSLLKGILAFKKEEYLMPPAHENAQGFDSLPADLQRKLLEMRKK